MALLNLCGADGEVPKWPNGADCKSVGASLRWFESTPLQIISLWRAHVAQLVEHILGKDEVTGSIPVVGSIENKGRNYERYHRVGMYRV